MKAVKIIQHIACFAAISLLCSFSQLKAQDIQIHVNYLQGIRYTDNWDAFKGGTELSADYLFRHNNMTYSGGLDFRTVQWGTQATLTLGAIRKMGNRLELGGNIQQGMALFRENPLYVLAGEAKVHYLFLQKKKITLGASWGLRYSTCPGYREYSLIYQLWEMPIGLFVRF
jgi:hypothetical protein